MYIFYDIEATDLDKNSSQIVQISMIATDKDLNVVSRLDLSCRLSPWNIPAPSAVLVTGLTPEKTGQAPLSHYEAMRELDRWLKNLGPDLPKWVGYNSNEYDSPVKASNLLQALFDPARQDAGNIDVFQIVKVLTAYAPGTLVLDRKNARGGASMKLTDVAEQNSVHLSAESAHNAGNDTEATLGVAKVARQHAPALWDQMEKMSTPEGVKNFLQAEPVVAYARIATTKATVFAVTGVTESHVFDLSFDPKPYLAMTVDELAKALADKKTPFLKYDAAKQPVFMPLDQSADLLPANYNEKRCESRAADIRADQGFAQRLKQAADKVKAAAPGYTALRPELAIYDLPQGAVKTAIESWEKEFHNAEEWEDRAKIAESFTRRFAAEIAAKPALAAYSAFAARIVFENAPETLSAEAADRVKRDIAARMLNTDPESKYNTIPKSLKALMKIRYEADIARQDPAKPSEWLQKEFARGGNNATFDATVRELKDYYMSLVKEYKPYLSDEQTKALNQFYWDMMRNVGKEEEPSKDNDGKKPPSKPDAPKP